MHRMTEVEESFQLPNPNVRKAGEGRQEEEGGRRRREAGGEGHDRG